MRFHDLRVHLGRLEGREKLPSASREDNGCFLRQLMQRSENGESIANGSVAEDTAQIAALTGSALVAASRRHFDPSRYVRVTLMPETP